MSELFDTTAYDLPGTPKLEGTKAGKVTLALETLELDRTDAEHMRIAGLLESGDAVILRLELGYAGDSWNRKPDRGPEKAYRCTIEEIVAT